MLCLFIINKKTRILTIFIDIKGQFCVGLCNMDVIWEDTFLCCGQQHGNIIHFYLHMQRRGAPYVEKSKSSTLVHFYFFSEIRCK